MYCYRKKGISLKTINYAGQADYSFAEMCVGVSRDAELDIIFYTLSVLGSYCPVSSFFCMDGTITENESTLSSPDKEITAGEECTQNYSLLHHCSSLTPFSDSHSGHAT